MRSRRSSGWPKSSCLSARLPVLLLDIACQTVEIVLADRYFAAAPEPVLRLKLVFQLELSWAAIGMVRHRSPLRGWTAVRGYIESLGPYQSLMLLAVPTSLVEPLKLLAVAIAGEGHWITGAVMIAFAYAASLLLVERLFAIVKPRLLTLPWFARLWSRFVVLRATIVGIFR